MRPWRTVKLLFFAGGFIAAFGFAVALIAGRAAGLGFEGAAAFTIGFVVIFAAGFPTLFGIGFAAAFVIGFVCAVGLLGIVFAGDVVRVTTGVFAAVAGTAMAGRGVAVRGSGGELNGGEAGDCG